MSNKKNLWGTVTAMALTAALAVGGTMAYFSNITEIKTNTFSNDSGIHTTLEETFDENEASNYYKGQVIAKVPTLTNDKSDSDIYVAMSLDYQSEAGQSLTYLPKGEEAGFTDFASIAYKTAEGSKKFNETDWQLIATAADGKELYMYKTALAKPADASSTGQTTNPLFNQTIVSDTIKEVVKTEVQGQKIFMINEQTGEKEEVSSKITQMNTSKTYYDEKGNLLDVFKLPTFQIDIRGYAIQADNTEEVRVDKLIELANSQLKTGSAPYQKI